MLNPDQVDRREEFTPQEREAALVLVSSLVFAAAAMPLRRLVPSLEVESLFLALGVFIVTLWIGRRSVGLRTRKLDERDWAIRYQAGIVSTHVFGIAVMVGAMTLCALHHGALMVPSVHVALLAYGSWMSMYAVWALTVLALYRRAG
jgi:hypothetical protein